MNRRQKRKVKVREFEAAKKNWIRHQGRHLRWQEEAKAKESK